MLSLGNVDTQLPQNALSLHCQLNHLKSSGRVRDSDTEGDAFSEFDGMFFFLVRLIFQFDLEDELHLWKCFLLGISQVRLESSLIIFTVNLMQPHPVICLLNSAYYAARHWSYILYFIFFVDKFVI